jgi:GntR family transcriptional regulator
MLAIKQLTVGKGQPLYQTVRDDILERVSAGEWAPGVALPSESQLAKAYGVGISTVRAAVSQLVAADVLLRHQGKGTFVTAHNVENDIYRFFHVVQNDGQKLLPKSHLLSFEKCRTDSKTADMLQLPHTNPEVFRIRNLLLVAGQPQVASNICVPTTLLPGLSKAVIEANQNTLYGLYQSRYGVMILKTHEKMWAKIPPAEISKLLRVPKGEPLLAIHRIGYTFGGQPAELRQSWVRTDVCHYEFSMGTSVEEQR